MALWISIKQRWHTRQAEMTVRAAHTLVAGWFLVTPFLFEYFRNQEATFSTWIGGGLLLLLALSSLLTLSPWEELLSLPVAGFLGWAAVRGGFSIITEAVWSHAGVAAVTVVLAAAALWLRFRPAGHRRRGDNLQVLAPAE